MWVAAAGGGEFVDARAHDGEAQAQADLAASHAFIDPGVPEIVRRTYRVVSRLVGSEHVHILTMKKLPNLTFQ